MIRLITSKKISITTTVEDYEIAKLAALAIGLHMFESVIPSPLPGVKPGVANVITLIVLYRYDFKAAASVSLLRVFASSLLFGQFLTPTFFLSLGGAISSLCALYFANKLNKNLFGPISISTFAAFAHILGQLTIVRYWLIPNDGVLYLLPVFLLAALIFGISNGIASSYLINKILKTN